MTPRSERSLWSTPSPVDLIERLNPVIDEAPDAYELAHHRYDMKDLKWHELLPETLTSIARGVRPDAKIEKEKATSWSDWTSSVEGNDDEVPTATPWCSTAAPSADKKVRQLQKGLSSALSRPSHTMNKGENEEPLDPSGLIYPPESEDTG